ncbi:MAG: NADH-quinone oxidoreductase subunit NuoN [Coxiellaceae bacterium]|nr:NADH-quinone oxidoreductase subunit NuoN [Coxiellaceae bacterium]
MQLLTTLYPILPELFILLMSCAILLIGVFSSNGAPRISFYCAQITLLIALLLLTQQTPSTTHFFYGLFANDKLALALKALMLTAMIFTIGYSHRYNTINGIPGNEFYVLALLSTIGMMVLVSGENLLMLFLGLELMSLPIYAMVALQRAKARAIEAAIKYFIMGSAASGILLYGFSLFYGATQTLDLSQIATTISVTPVTQDLILYFGLVFVIVGLAFKLGAAPFHAWVPDIYDGAPNSVTLLISAAPKLAAFGLTVRFLVDAAPGLQIQWDHVLIAIALISIAVGNFAAIIQSNMKRLLAYSSIAHMGYMILGLACGTARGDAAAFFYMITYVLTSLGAFGMIALLSRDGFEANELSDFSGLSHRQPWMAFMMLLMMFSLAGIPPLVGFIAKVGILEALIQNHAVWLAVIAIIFSIVGAYYYIRVVKVMYFEDKNPGAVRTSISRGTSVVMSVNVLLLLLIGIFPSQLFLWCHAVFGM